MRSRNPVDALRRSLRSPRLILVEAIAVVATGLVSTFVPQAPSLTERIRFADHAPLLAKLAGPLGLHRVFTSWWFLGLVLLATGSLLVVLFDQWKRLLREWSATPAPASFGSAPYRAEFVRPARGAGPSERIERSGRLGIAGSAVFHVGLLLLIGAGVGRLLVGSDAAVELYEGETLPPGPEAFQAQWPGLLAGPVATATPVTLLRIEPRWHRSGRLDRLGARLLVGEGGGAHEARVEVNAPLDLDAARLYVTQDYGVAAMYEIVGGPAAGQHVSLLEAYQDGEFVRAENLPGGYVLRGRSEVHGSEGRPEALELRVLRAGGLLAADRLVPGAVLRLPDGVRLRLYDLRWWARFNGARDGSVIPAYAGFAVVILGAVLMFGVVPVETLVQVIPEDGLERVTVALRARRFVPIFAERFRARVEREGGPSQERRS